MPVLSNILLEAKNNQLRLAATNREIGINCWIAAKVEDEGAITVPARLLSEFVNSLPSTAITMDLAEATQRLQMKCAGFRANMNGISAYEFPILGTVAEVQGQVLAIGAATLSAMIAGVVVAASEDENRPTLKGVEVTIRDGDIMMAATDGYRLGYRRQDIAHGSDDKLTVIVPHEALETLGKFSLEADGEIDVVISANQIVFGLKAGQDAKWQRVEMSCHLIDARFPDWRATVPKSHNTKVVIDTKALTSAVRTAMLFARDSANVVTFDVKKSAQGPHDRLTIVAKSPEMGDNESVLDCAIEGEDMTINFNGKLTLEALSTIATNRTVLEMMSAIRPGVFYPEGTTTHDAMHVIMPMMGK
jgi:DNA polymerase III subunit beta